GVRRAAGRAGLLQSLLAPRQQPLVAVGGPQGVEVGRHAADRGSVGATVVVDDDEELARRPGVVRRNGVERLPRHYAGPRTVADHGEALSVGRDAQQLDSFYHGSTRSIG